MKIKSKDSNAGAGWQNTILGQRNDMLKVLDDNMSLKVNIQQHIYS